MYRVVLSSGHLDSVSQACEAISCGVEGSGVSPNLEYGVSFRSCVAPPGGESFGGGFGIEVRAQVRENFNLVGGGEPKIGNTDPRTKVLECF